jgi:nucleotide-binding universal stress UspA family protein
MPAADNATRIGGHVARACQAETTLLGIAEQPVDEQPLRNALEAEAEKLRAQGVTLKIAVGAGEPVREILRQTAETPPDLVIIGGKRKGMTGLYWCSEKVYEVIKAIPAPVIVAVGECAQLQRFLVCTGGKEYIAEGIRLTGKIAAAVGAAVTLLHVMAEPPAMYADLVELEEDLDRLLESKSELGINLVRQKQDLERLGVPTQVRIRHGLVIDQVFEEVAQGDYDVIVTGTSPARGVVRHYIMGDLTRTILNRANCPILVVRPGRASGRSLWQSLKRAFASPE